MLQHLGARIQLSVWENQFSFEYNWYPFFLWLQFDELACLLSRLPASGEGICAKLRFKDDHDLGSHLMKVPWLPFLADTELSVFGVVQTNLLQYFIQPECVPSLWRHLQLTCRSSSFSLVEEANANPPRIWSPWNLSCSSTILWSNYCHNFWARVHHWHS